MVERLLVLSHHIKCMESR